MCLLALLNRRTGQRSCDTIRGTVKITALDEKLLHMLHNRPAHPLLYEDMRRLGRCVYRKGGTHGEHGS